MSNIIWVTGQRFSLSRPHSCTMLSLVMENKCCQWHTVCVPLFLQGHGEKESIRPQVSGPRKVYSEKASGHFYRTLPNGEFQRDCRLQELWNPNNFHLQVFRPVVLRKPANIHLGTTAHLTAFWWHFVWVCVLVVLVKQWLCWMIWLSRERRSIAILKVGYHTAQMTNA